MTEHEATKTQHTILVIEDEPELRRITAVTLETRFGYRVLSAEDGASGVVQAEEFQPDLILMDLAMSGMDGIAATRLIKEREATRHIPVIAYSNYAGIQTWQKTAKSVGCARCISKVIKHEDLDRIIQEVLAEAKSA